MMIHCKLVTDMDMYPIPMVRHVEALDETWACLVRQMTNASWANEIMGKIK